MSERQQVYTMSLAEFNRYLTSKAAELRACYQEIEEIQMQFNDIFKKELAAWQETFKYCFPRVLTQRRELVPVLVERIDQAEQEELTKLKQELQALSASILENRQKADDLLQQAQNASAALRSANPELDADEEKLKAKLVQKEDEFAKLYEQIDALEAGLGKVWNSGKIAKLKLQQRSIKASQDKLLKKLRDVRKTWQDQLEQVGQTQSELRQEWEKIGVTASQAQARYDFVTANLDDLAQQQAITRVLSDLDASPSVEGELGQALDKLVERNKVQQAYETGLRSVAEALGLTKGVAEGVERFAKSVGGVVEEQTRYSLKEVDVQLPQWVINVIETWKPLRERVKDEKYLGTHPLEFSAIVKSFISDRITDDIIQRFFETMGDALNAATSAWPKSS